MPPFSFTRPGSVCSGKVAIWKPDRNGPQMTPKDEQNARIAERDKYLAVLDAAFQLHQAGIRLLRQSGDLETRSERPADDPQGRAERAHRGARQISRRPRCRLSASPGRDPSAPAKWRSGNQIGTARR